MHPALQESLEYLFEGYCSSSGTGIFSLAEIAIKHKIQGTELGSALNNQGWIKNPNFGPFGFRCQISRLGIHQIHPEYFDDLISEALTAAGLTSDWIGLIETVADFEPKDYQRAHDLGKEFEESGLAEIQYQAQEVYIKLTLQGIERYRTENEGSFF
jgi:hypothetical protein